MSKARKRVLVPDLHPDYKEALEVREIAEDLISTVHPRLELAHINYAFRLRRRAARLDATRRDDYDAAACAHLLSDEERYLSGGNWDFLVWVWKDIWDSETPHWRRYVVDHELSHCGVKERRERPMMTITFQRGPDGDVIVTEPQTEPPTRGYECFIVPHPIEDFPEVLRRNGMPPDYLNALRMTSRVAPLVPLPGSELFGWEPSHALGAPSLPFGKLDSSRVAPFSSDD